MMTLDKFYDLIDRNAKVTLKDGRSRKAYYSGSVKDIPDEYSICAVEDFTMDDSGRLTFKIKVKEARLAGTNWKEGVIKVYGDAYHYWVKQYDEPSEEYGLSGGRISKLMIKRQGEIVANYDRGWDVKPVDQGAEMAMAIICHEYTI